MRPIGIWRHALGDDLDPEAATNFCAKAIEIQKSLNSVVTLLHPINISDIDNYQRHPKGGFDRKKGRSDGVQSECSIGHDGRSSLHKTGCNPLCRCQFRDRAQPTG